MKKNHRRRLSSLAAVLTGALLLALPAAAQDDPPATEPAGEAPPEEAAPDELTVLRARLVGEPGNRHVRGILRWLGGGGRVDWSQQGDRIAFDRVGERGRYQIYTARSDGTGEECLTCGLYELRNLHCLSPEWHPSGDYVIFQTQDLPRRMWHDPAQLATPHRGLHGELWVVTRNSRYTWRLTKISEQGGAVVDPHFSHEGDRLVWSERVSSRNGPWGQWLVRVSEFRIKRGLPRLGAVEKYEPEIAPGFLVADGFTPDDRALWVAAAPDPGQPDRGRDLLRLELDGGRIEPVTDTPGVFEGVARVSPRRSDLVVFVSDRNLPNPRFGVLPYRADLWTLEGRGGRQERLTFFNHPDSDHALGEALIDDVAWSPEGDRLLLHVVAAGPEAARSAAERTGREVEGPPVDEAIYMVELDETFRR